MSVAFGAPIHGEFSSADASALSEPNSRIGLYKGGSIKTDSVLVLGATDKVFISSLLIAVGATALTVTIYDGSDNAVDAGEVIAVVVLAVNSTVAIDWTQTPRRGPIGAGGIPFPKVKTSAGGQVYVTLLGTVAAGL